MLIPSKKEMILLQLGLNADTYKVINKDWESFTILNIKTGKKVSIRR